MKEWLSVVEAAKVFGISEKMIRARCADGTLEHFRPGRRPRSPIRIRRASLERWSKNAQERPT